MTKKLFYFVIAAALICGASVFTSCTNDDNPVAEPDLGVAEKIIGKWITAESDGETMPTNEKVVLDFVSTTEAYVSLSIQDRTAEDTPWRDREESDVESLHIYFRKDRTSMSSRPFPQKCCTLRHLPFRDNTCRLS